MTIDQMKILMDKGYTDSDFKDLLDLSKRVEGDTGVLLDLAYTGVKPVTIEGLLFPTLEKDTPTQNESKPEQNEPKPEQNEPKPDGENEKLTARIAELEKELNQAQQINRNMNQQKEAPNYEEQLLKMVERYF